MLNKKKQITTISNSFFLKTTLFFNLPKIPKTSYFQTDSSENVLNELNTLFEKRSKKHFKPFRFSFSQHIVRSYFFLTEHFIKQKTIKSNLKKNVLFLKELLKKKKRYCFFFLKRIKGGFFYVLLRLDFFHSKKFSW